MARPIRQRYSSSIAYPNGTFHHRKAMKMDKKNNIKHPAFIIGAGSYLALLIGIVLKGNLVPWANYMIISAIILAAIHWVWSIVTVFNDEELKGTPSRPFWILVVIILAPLGGMLYFAMLRKRVSF